MAPSPARSHFAPSGIDGGGSPMAQLSVSWVICRGRLRVHAINAVGRRSGRIIEIEDTDTGERIQGAPRKLERLVRARRSAGGEVDAVSPWAPDPTSQGSTTASCVRARW